MVDLTIHVCGSDGYDLVSLLEVEVWSELIVGLRLLYMVHISLLGLLAFAGD
jgi:hypothetical protein